MRGKRLELEGETFGNLKVLRRVENGGKGSSRWLCRCRCGNTRIVDGWRLVDGSVRSCGCTSRGNRTAGLNLSWLERGRGDPYVNLASAVVAVAANDYRIALKEEDEELIADLEEFFYSEWFRNLTGINADWLVRTLQKEKDNEIIYI